MTQQCIVILGSASDSDHKLLERYCARANLAIEQIPDFPTGFNPSELSERAIAYVAYLPHQRASILKTLSLLPLSPHRETLFFQGIAESQDIDYSNIADLPIHGLFNIPICESFAQTIVSTAYRWGELTQCNHELNNELIRERHQMQQILNIGTYLSSHMTLQTLLERILHETREIVNADAGSIYLLENFSSKGAQEKELRFKVTQNDSVDMNVRASLSALPLDHNTIAWYVASTGKSLIIADVYNIDPALPYKFGKFFDEQTGYRAQSMLSIPLKNFSGETVGVLQLINKKRDKTQRLTATIVPDAVIPFARSDEAVLLSIASQAAVSIERTQLFEDIRQLFEGYLSSSITAIEERDRVTSGHSLRVTEYAMAFVDAINTVKSGPLATEHFDENRRRQFKFAALLHDIGKIGVPEAVLTKEHKLTADAMQALRMRVEYIKLCLSLSLPGLAWHSAAEIEDDFTFLKKINGAGFLADDEFKRLSELSTRYVAGSDGQPIRFLSDDDMLNLSIRRGNLTNQERDFINSHAEASRRILSKIPWPRELQQIPGIAGHHHERMDGSGYPDGLKGENILLESRILSVIDIYEAITAQDRPYKPAMPPEKALAILNKEVEFGHLDATIVELFISREIYKIFIKPVSIDELPR